MCNDGCAVSLREFLVTIRRAERTRAAQRGAAVPAIEDFVPDALGIAMQAGDPPAGQEHTLLCFVRWNHAVRRELKETLDKVGAKINSCSMRGIVAVIAICAAILIIFEVITLTIAFSHPKGPGTYDPLQGVVATFAIIQFFFVVVLFITFHDRVKGGRGVCCFWFSFIVVHSIMAVSYEEEIGLAQFFVFVVWTVLHITYNIYLIKTMADIVECSICATLFPCSSCCESCCCTSCGSKDCKDSIGRPSTAPVIPSQKLATERELPPV